ncbi:DBP [Pieris rapae granulovirus]|nr:DBP [Pieris rapae granulovirus]
MSNSSQELVTVRSLTPKYENGEEIKWDLQLIKRLNLHATEAEKKIKCSTNDFVSNIVQLQKYSRINDIANHIHYDDAIGIYKYNDSKLQIYKVDKSEKKTQYSFGFKTLSKPRLCYMWDKAQLKLCKGGFGDFHILTMANEASLINIMEQIMGVYMHKIQRQSEPIPLTMEEGSLISVPKDIANKEKFMSRFFVLNSSENMKNIENNNVEEPIMLNRMSLQVYNELFNISDDKKVSDSQEFIVCTVFNGVEEKTKILQPSKESQFTFSLWLTPLIFIYVKN